MKVGMIVHAYYLKDARVRRYAELLAAEGHQVDVLDLREAGALPVAAHLGVNLHSIHQTRLRGGQLSYLYEYISSFFRFFVKINSLYLRGRRFDVLHIHNMPDFLVFTGLFQKLLGARVILDVHDLMSEVYQSKYFLSRNHWLPRLLRVEEAWSAAFASAVITANHAFADILVSRGVRPSKVTVIMNTPDSRFYLSEADGLAARARRVSGEFSVVYVGTLAPRYGVEIAVRAIVKLLRDESIPGLRFSIIPKIANEGSYVDELRREIEGCGFRDRFRIMDPVPHDEMPAVLAAADVMVYTPLPDIHTDIALSLKIPEAIAVGCPIVAARVSVNERYFGETALFMFEPGNVDDCASKILEVFMDEGKTRAKVTAAKAKLDEITWSKQAEVYRSLLRQLLPSAARPVETVR